MNILTNSKIKKIILVLIVLVIIANFIMPNYVHAVNYGAILVKSIFYLVVRLSDVFLSLMQRAMVGTVYINYQGEYEIKYSPGIIFMGEAPALDINFISADETHDLKVSVPYDPQDDGSMELLLKSLSNKGIKFTKEKEISRVSTDFPDEYNDFSDTLLNAGFDCSNNERVDKAYKYTLVGGSNRSNAILNNMGIDWRYAPSNGLQYFGTDFFGGLIAGTYTKYLWVNGENIYCYIEHSTGTNVNHYLYSAVIPDEILYSEENVNVVQSTAKQIKSVISQWYYALRTIALVGLLSVLLYLGIKIILSSSSAQSRAKYKNMLIDWIVAICILFVLHYFMAFLLEISDMLNNIFISNVIEETTTENTHEKVEYVGDGGGFKALRTDKLMSTIRNKAGEWQENDVSISEEATYTIIYAVMVILTGVFTFQYLKRVVFMAFLTVSAPLIAFTYPIDKLRDGKAQAFNYWLKEYIYNCIIQTVHLALYTVFVGSAIEFAESNPLYAIVALAFLVPAEKFIKEMFGLKSGGPSAALNAAAGGAIVMSMLNKIKSKDAKKGDDKNSSGSKGVRTANSNPTGGSGGGGAGGSIPGSTSSSSAPGSTSSSSAPGSKSSSSVSGGGSGGSSIKGASRAGRRTIGGASAVGSAGGRLFRTAVGAAAGLGAGTIALAANIADGDLFNDPSKALTEIGATTFAGYHTGSNFTGNRINNAKNAADWLKKNSLGIEEYNNRNFDKKFYQSEDYKYISENQDVINACKTAGVSIPNAVQLFLDNGITDKNEIIDSLSNGIGGDDRKEFSKAGVSDGKNMAKLVGAGLNASGYKEFEKAGVKDADVISGAMSKLSGKSLSVEEIARRTSIAENLKKQGYTTESKAKGYFAKKGLSSSDVDSMYDEIKDLL